MPTLLGYCASWIKGSEEIREDSLPFPLFYGSFGKELLDQRLACWWVPVETLCLLEGASTGMAPQPTKFGILMAPYAAISSSRGLPGMTCGPGGGL